jgi:hypothetical protein
MAKPSDRGSKLRDVFTRERALPGSLKNLFANIDYQGAERDKAFTEAGARWAIIVVSIFLVFFTLASSH